MEITGEISIVKSGRKDSLSNASPPVPQSSENVERQAERCPPAEHPITPTLSISMP